MESTLLTEFEQTLDKGLNKATAKNLLHADKFDRDQFDHKNIGFSKVPQIKPQLARGNNFNASLSKVTSSDPYNEMFGVNNLH